jgi:hypothetical protein
MRVLGRSADEEWWQVYLPEPLNMIGWIWRENINLFGRCSDLPDTSANPEPDAPSLPPADAELPAFAQSLAFEDTDRIFVLNDGMLYVRHEVPGQGREKGIQAHILLADLSAPQLDVRVHLGAVPDVKATLISDMVKDTGAFAAINGDFYGGNYMPQGLTVINNEIITAPKHRATFAITEDHQPFIGYFTRDWTWFATVTAANGAVIPLQLVNLPCNPAWVCLYTDALKRLPIKYGYEGVRVLLSPEYEVLQMTQGTLEIPEGHFVLRAGAYSDAGQWLSENVKVGDTLALDLATFPDWRDYEYAISGGPLIVQSGEFYQDCDPDAPEARRECEEFDENFRYERYFENHTPRSAVGYNRAANVLILIVVEGYEIDHSGGMTPRQLADLFIRFGAERAMEFDGGGSAALWIDRGFVNDFGYRGERRVSNSLMLFWNE